MLLYKQKERRYAFIYDKFDKEKRLSRKEIYCFYQFIEQIKIFKVKFIIISKLINCRLM
jgi:hypothetical protein